MVYIQTFAIYSDLKNASDRTEPISKNYLSVPMAKEILDPVDDFEVVDIEELSQTVCQSIVDRLSYARETDKFITEYIARQFSTYIRESAPKSWMAIQTDDVFLIDTRFRSTVVIGTTEATARRAVKMFKDGVQALNDELDEGEPYEWLLITGSDFARELSSQLCTEVIERGEPDPFEERVIKDVQLKATDSIDTNVKLKFDGKVVESTEFDILLHVTRNARIYIEVKDATHEDAVLSKSDLVTTPNDNANRIRRYVAQNHGERDAPEETEVIVVVRGMDERRFQDIQSVAQNRDVHLVEYDDGDWIETLEQIIKGLIVTQTIGWCFT